MEPYKKKMLVWGGIVAMVVLAFLFFGLPVWNVWSQRMSGEAALAHAEYERQTLVQEAKAKHEAAKELAQAEIERAKGVAQANKIIGEGLKGNHEYLMYLWIHGLAEIGGHQVIYVPTEGGLPILEAGRFSAPVRQKGKGGK